MTTADPSGNMI